MNRFRLVVLAVTAILALALGVFALVLPQDRGDDVIIIKGGSLTVQCGNANNTNCMPYDAKTKEYKHKKSNGKIEQIVVKDSAGTVLGTFTKGEHFSDGKPIIEITYK